MFQKTLPERYSSFTIRIFKLSVYYTKQLLNVFFQIPI
ncbi:hypothetical protein Cabys_1532 [Caldithrix abyssi DSM 13497]|uniref:Uncharacterized protein n=1 Tax=Caldithrix abyssi DSM 13497 TaxID=880073 RepID=A0A1J1C7K6_CALAY|nr:hypothetical protein Cabys_1532 [Caldithrix abyssi DSM 13497]